MHTAYFAVGDQLAPIKSHPNMALMSHTCSDSNPKETQYPVECDLPPTITRAIHRIITWREGIFSSLFTQGQRLVLVEIVRCASWSRPHEDIHVGNPTLAMRLDVSVATIKRSLKFLEEMGWITREQLRSGKNMFMGCATKLSKEAIEQLGLTSPLPHHSQKIDSPTDSVAGPFFFRGSAMTPTIGILDIQSSSKRQQGQSPATGPSSSERKDEAKRTSVTKKEKSGERAEASSSTDSQEIIEMIRIPSHGNHGNLMSIPKTLAPLLQRLAAPQICKLMVDAKRAGHLLEDVVLSCIEPILSSRIPMAYIRQLIACDKDWAWVRRAGQEKIKADQEEKAVIREASEQKSKEKEFLKKNKGAHLVNHDSSTVYIIDDVSCTAWTVESGRIHKGRVIVSAKFIEAVDCGRLARVSSQASADIINQWS